MLLVNCIESLSVNLKMPTYSIVDVKIKNPFFLVSCWAFVYIIINTKEIQSVFFFILKEQENLIYWMGISYIEPNSWYSFSYPYIYWNQGGYS